MLHEEVELYSRLTGKDGYKTPISIIGAYLDGYEKGKADAQPETTTMTVGRTKGEITMWYECDNCGEPVDQSDNYCRNCGRKFRKDG